jgi:hypothetical protein
MDTTHVKSRNIFSKLGDDFPSPVAGVAGEGEGEGKIRVTTSPLILSLHRRARKFMDLGKDHIRT